MDSTIWLNFKSYFDSPSDESNTRTFKSSMEPQHLPSWIPSICRDAPGMPTGNRRLVFPSSAFNAWSHGVIHGGCCRLSWMHRDCVAAYACSAGLHHIKCPICSNREAFINTIIDFGVWVPDRQVKSWTFLFLLIKRLRKERDSLREHLNRTHCKC